LAINREKVKNGFLLVKYENVKNDTFKAIKDILSFIEINISDEAINWSSFDNMKKMESNQQNIDLFKQSTPKINFMRSGKYRDRKDILSNPNIAKINDIFGETLKK